MAVAYFQVRLSIEKKSGGEAALSAPAVLQNQNYDFVLVKDGGDEGIVKVDTPDTTLKQIEKDKDCKRLTAKQLEALKGSYPKPKIKNKYRTLAQNAAGGTDKTAGGFELDSAGSKIVDTVQTVRSGFYLIDVRIAQESDDNS